MVARAHALSRGGRGLEAAQQYLQAAESAQGEAQLQLRVLSAQQLLEAGRFAEGMAAARVVLAELGVPLPGSAWAMRLRSRWDQLALRWTRATSMRPRAALNTGVRMQLDALWALAKPLGWFDALAHGALTSRYLRLSSRYHDPGHHILRLAEEARSRVCALRAISRARG